ncbi:hypothetical protein MKX03_014464 [Papaver bracteatum]|nr:hypothetical protein MKX03_014464 [Papaver bracteatum]
MVNIIGADRFHNESDEEFENGYFTLKRLNAATKKFSKESRIRWGSVYKGILPNGMNIAVKRINITREDAKLQNEVNMMSTLRHPNVARLFGHCKLKDEGLLVYEYMENGSLGRALFGNGNLKTRLNLHIRVQICLGIAKGLAFLHHKDKSKAMIVHRAIKPANILLDKFLNPKISDFGLLAKNFGEHSTSIVPGTFGYLDPQYCITGTATEKSDVYSFGVVILVLMSGRYASYISAAGHTEKLLEVAHELHRNADLLSLVDKELKASMTTKEATMLLHLEILCTNHSHELRPAMSEIVNILEGKIVMKTPPVNPQYFTKYNFEEVMSDVECCSISTETELAGQGFVSDLEDVYNGNGGEATESSQEKVKEESTPSEVINDFVSDLKSFLSEGDEVNDNHEYVAPSEDTHEQYENGTFNLRYLEVATKNFSPANKIGQGSCGSVYKIDISNEVNIVSTLRHPNLVRLFGNCTENDQQSLVYEYMENGCLNKALFGSIDLKKKLTWPARVRICIGVASGLAFLHDDNSKVKIIHRDIKLSNILLDKDLNPKISDFGLVMHYPREITHINTKLAGTIGYMAPEYVIRGTVTEKIDVYSFGVEFSGKQIMKAYNALQKGHLLELIDQDLEMDIPAKDVEMVINLALLCTHTDPKLRPTMSEVVSILEGRTAINSTPYSLKYTRRFNHTTESIADISTCNLSGSTSTHNENSNSTNGASGTYEGRAILPSSPVLPVEQQYRNDVDLHQEFASDGSETVAAYEPPRLNDTPTFPVYEQAPIREHKSRPEYVKPTFEEGTLHVECSDEEFQDGCNDWKNSLVGFFAGEEGYLDTDIEMVEELWEVKGNFSMFAMDNGFYLFKFSCARDKIRILESADLWKIQQRQLILREWNWKFNFDRTEMKSVPVWVKIYNLPLFLWTTTFFSKIGSGLGIPLLTYAMLCIEVEAHTSLPESLNIVVKGIKYQLDIEYDLRTLKFASCSTFRQIDTKM